MKKMNLNGFLKIMRPVMKTVFTALIIFFISLNCLEAKDKKKNEPAVKKTTTTVYNVMDFGAKGDGKFLDSPAINKAIEEAASKGGGTVCLPAGIYLSVSIRLKSNITLFIDQGATILAASSSDTIKYDAPEPNIWGDSLIAMRDIVNAPIFLRLGARICGPKEVPVGDLRRVIISNITVYNADPKNGCIISGNESEDIEDIRLSNIRIYYNGGGTAVQAAREVPGFEKDYPEPYRFGTMPSYGFFVRHVKDIQFNNVEVTLLKDDQRPAFVLDDVKGVDFNFVKAQKSVNIPSIILKNVRNLKLYRSFNMVDKNIEVVENEKF